MVFARAESDAVATPGTWFTYPRSALERMKHERHGHVAVVCPTCHSTLTLGSVVHTVFDDGTVHPSFVCTSSGCSFHEFIRLAEW